jgi:hypothetical protein
MRAFDRDLIRGGHYGQRPSVPRRPNTWLHRPSLPREDSRCQPGAVHTWPFAAIQDVRYQVGNRGQSGHGGDIAKPTQMTDAVEKVRFDWNGRFGAT